MIWFGSSVGVAISSIFSEAKSATASGKGRLVCDYRLPSGIDCNVIGDRVAPRTEGAARVGQREWLAERVTSVEAKKAPWQLA